MINMMKTNQLPKEEYKKLFYLSKNTNYRRVIPILPALDEKCLDCGRFKNN